jgi:hypothetical protein
MSPLGTPTLHMHDPAATVELYWLPLGAGGHCVRASGRVFEFVAAALGSRDARRLYHSALVVRLPGEEPVVIEQAAVPDAHGERRGVVGTGAVGTHTARRARVFRYEVRRWPGGVISDIDEAVESPRGLTTDTQVARRVLRLVPHVPTPVWGRDEFGAGEMWNSNSVISWLITQGGLDVEAIVPPAGGRAPGWDAGIAIARRTAPARATRDLSAAHA